MSVFGSIDIYRIGAEHIALAIFLESKGNILRQLTAHTDNDTRSSLEFVNVQDPLER